jgi:hypothetical protein
MLKDVSSKKDYAECARLLQVCLPHVSDSKVINGLMEGFQTFKNVHQIRHLFETIAMMQEGLKKEIFFEFERAFTKNTVRSQCSMLSDCCTVLEVLPNDAKKEMVEWYCKLQLEDYRVLFRNNPEVSGLSDINRRYSWLKRALKTFDDEHNMVFPPVWDVAQYLCERFCLETK